MEDEVSLAEEEEAGVGMSRRWVWPGIVEGKERENGEGRRRRC